MKYYRLNNVIYAYDDEQVAIGLANDKTELTAEELELHLNPPKTPEQLEAEARQAKEQSLNSITVTTTSGKVFDGRDKDRARMTEAIDASRDLMEEEYARFAAISEPSEEDTIQHSAIIKSLTETQWKLHDNSTVTVTLAELKEARALAIKAVGLIILGGQ